MGTSCSFLITRAVQKGFGNTFQLIVKLLLLQDVHKSNQSRIQILANRSKMELFVKIVKRPKVVEPLTIFAKSSILDVCLGSEYALGYYYVSVNVTIMLLLCHNYIYFVVTILYFLIIM